MKQHGWRVGSQFSSTGRKPSQRKMLPASAMPLMRILAHVVQKLPVLLSRKRFRKRAGQVSEKMNSRTSAHEDDTPYTYPLKDGLHPLIVGAAGDLIGMNAKGVKGWSGHGVGT